MILPSEPTLDTSVSASIPSASSGTAVMGTADAAALPALLMEKTNRSVARLEFYSMDQPAIPTQMGVDVQSGKEALLLEQLEALTYQLRSEAAEMPARLEEARRSTREESDREWEQRLEVLAKAERMRTVDFSDLFQRERNKYFAAVEAEVVKLSLAIAERVLHRETKLDPLLLTGVVRVALSKIAEDSTSVLRIPKADLAKWRANIAEAQHPELRLVGDEVLQAGECVLETDVGRVELGIAAQLQEIERGFFDLLQQRPS